MEGAGGGGVLLERPACHGPPLTKHLLFSAPIRPAKPHQPRTAAASPPATGLDTTRATTTVMSSGLPPLYSFPCCWASTWMGDVTSRSKEVANATCFKMSAISQDVLPVHQQQEAVQAEGGGAMQ